MAGITYNIDRRDKMTLWERMWLPEIFRGMFITAKHFFRSMQNMRKLSTVEYPEVKTPVPAGYRAEHRLMKREDGSVRCTSCMLCSTVCPARCIEIIPEDVGDNVIEKRPKVFTINELRCVFCGLCVEACPCDAIRMDTGKYENATFNRSDAIYGINKLLDNSADGQSSLSSALY